MDFKYLNDGRKVAVIGQLNNQETIVQEVFISKSGDEIPSGERFVVKSLHDEPVMSYKAKEEERLAQVCKELGALVEAKNKEVKKVQNELKAYKDRLSSVGKLVDKLPEAELEAFTLFLSGSASHLVFYEYGLSEPMDFNDATISTKYGRYEGLKLMSVFGRSNGDLEYKVNDYNDGSGGWKKCIPCRSYEHALEVIKGLAVGKIEEGQFSKASYDLCRKLGIKLPAAALKKYKQERKEALEKTIAHAKSKLEESEQQISTYEAEMAELTARKDQNNE